MPFYSYLTMSWIGGKPKNLLKEIWGFSCVMVLSCNTCWSRVFIGEEEIWMLFLWHFFLFSWSHQIGYKYSAPSEEIRLSTGILKMENHQNLYGKETRWLWIQEIVTIECNNMKQWNHSSNVNPYTKERNQEDVCSWVYQRRKTEPD